LIPKFATEVAANICELRNRSTSGPILTVKTTTHSERSIAGLPADTTATFEAKWLGACEADQKPGDIVMPGGFKLNIKDAEKLKGLLPK
jgi:hypothetical protein